MTVELPTILKKHYHNSASEADIAYLRTFPNPSEAEMYQNQSTSLAVEEPDQGPYAVKPRTIIGRKRNAELLRDQFRE